MNPNVHQKLDRGVKNWWGLCIGVGLQKELLSTCQPRCSPCTVVLGRHPPPQNGISGPNNSFSITPNFVSPVCTIIKLENQPTRGRTVECTRKIRPARDPALPSGSSPPERGGRLHPARQDTPCGVFFGTRVIPLQVWQREDERSMVLRLRLATGRRCVSPPPLTLRGHRDRQSSVPATSCRAHAGQKCPPSPAPPPPAGTANGGPS